MGTAYFYDGRAVANIAPPSRVSNSFARASLVLLGWLDDLFSQAVFILENFKFYLKKILVIIRFQSLRHRNRVRQVRIRQVSRFSVSNTAVNARLSNSENDKLDTNARIIYPRGSSLSDNFKYVIVFGENTSTLVPGPQITNIAVTPYTSDAEFLEMLRIALENRNISLITKMKQLLSAKKLAPIYVKRDNENQIKKAEHQWNVTPIDHHGSVDLVESNQMRKLGLLPEGPLGQRLPIDLHILERYYLFRDCADTQRIIISRIPQYRSSIENAEGFSSDAYGLAMYATFSITRGFIFLMFGITLYVYGILIVKDFPGSVDIAASIATIIATIILVLLTGTTIISNSELGSLLDEALLALSLVLLVAQFLYEMVLNLTLLLISVALKKSVSLVWRAKVRCKMALRHVLYIVMSLMLEAQSLCLMALSPVVGLLPSENLPKYLERKTWRGHPVVIISIGKLRTSLIYAGWETDIAKPGIVRLSWKCKCGRRFSQDVKQSQIDTGFFSELLTEVLPNTTSPSSGAAGPSKSSEENVGSGLVAVGHVSEKASLHHPSENTSAREGNLQADRALEPVSEIRQRGLRKRRTTIDKWILVSIPQDRRYHRLEHIVALKKKGDMDVFQDIQSLYNNLRPKASRLWDMRDFTRIRLVKFDVRKIQSSKSSREVVIRSEKWEPPDAITGPDWEYSNQGDVGLDTLPEFLLYLWHLAEETKTTKPLDEPEPCSTTDVTPRDVEDTLPITEISRPKLKPFWADSIRTIKIFTLSKAKKHSTPSHTKAGLFNFWLISQWCSSFVSSSKKLSPTTVQSELPDPPSPPDFGIEIEINPPTSWALESIPRKIRSKLVSDPSCRRVVVGWGLWIEEDFIIPGIALILINLVPVVFFAMSAALTVKHGIAWFVIAGYGVSFATFIFTQWIVKKKDSNR
ncbi:hypothetical protein AOQ84DRAFT_421171 [Glonium stellatum]|uniref:Uncharacterized protein n=1 Tax=Glonium stellatum TaxID=574774 RepID=A0A8E2JWV1_9PEZI|nr:hypothetical protein AOQ84DRAFT_421171 [Glonium stellatum]